MLKKIYILFSLIGFLFVHSCIFSQSLPNGSIKFYVDFLKDTTFLSPKEYILKSFEEKDIIILTERLHPEFKQYEMIVEVIQDKRFTGHIYTEVGVFNAGEKINNFLRKEGLSAIEVKEQILDIYKDLDYSPLWVNYNYYYLLENIYWTNQQRQPNEKIMLHPLDVTFSWDSMECPEQYNMFMNMMESYIIDRDVIMAKHFIEKYDQEKHINSNKKKALIIMNTYHGYTRIPKYQPHPTRPLIYSTAEYIYKTFPNLTKGILINGLSSSGELVANGKWDAAFEFVGNKNVGFDMKNTPFGETKFDMYIFEGNNYESVNFDFIFDGFVFYEPIENFEMISGIPGIFTDKAFVTEFYRRLSMMKGVEENNYIEEFNFKKINKKSNLDKYKDLINRWLIE
ncbi:MAG: hypothetical protein LBG80_08040 [Bacteroidales bacterium]|jgi:hypothetical protein|nr:hypothetical protein [Bacteroidales bacterium]